MIITINNEHISEESIVEEKAKVRALIVTDDKKVLIANYGSTLLLPGGTIDSDEEPLTSMIRELKEEVGTEYTKEELKYFVSTKYYQQNYLKRNGVIANRLITTYVFLAKYKGFSVDNQKLTEREKNDNFYLKLISLDELKEILFKYSKEDSRRAFFAKELEIILNAYEENIIDTKVLKKEI